jgi:hypothetical protein
MTDTTGCGDVFHGAYALGLCEGMAPLEAARFATAAAALKGERARGWNGMADRAAVEALLAMSTLCSGPGDRRKTKMRVAITKITCIIMAITKKRRSGGYLLLTPQRRMARMRSGVPKAGLAAKDRALSGRPLFGAAHARRRTRRSISKPAREGVD